MPRIDYLSEGFPAGGPVANCPAVLTASWDDLLWAAVTVGRPNRNYVFRHGTASMYEALFRWSLVRMALEQRGPRGSRFHRTDAARSLDPSEKGAVNYFLGMATCKLFAARLLDAPWLLHLDVFRPMLNPFLTGRSRPDLLGQTQSGQWLAFESKGRASPPAADAKNKAKGQAERCTRVNGIPVTYQIGGIMYFKNDSLQFFWRDPQSSDPDGPRDIVLSVRDDLWQYYYRPTVELISSNPRFLKQMLQEPVLMPVENLDLQIGVLPPVLSFLVKHEWARAKQLCAERLGKGELGYQPDGVRVVAGESWLQPLGEYEGR
jgi:hypothetical protein